MPNPSDPVVWTHTKDNRTLSLVYDRSKKQYVAYLERGEDVWAVCLFTSRGEVLTWPVSSPGLEAHESSNLLDAVHELTWMAQVHDS